MIQEEEGSARPEGSPDEEGRRSPGYETAGRRDRALEDVPQRAIRESPLQ